MEAESPSDLKLSAALIVKDETDTLRACLASIKDAVDEIVVAWNGSSAETKAILQEFGCTIVPYEWKDDFADARNFSFSHTTHDLVLWCDADDVVAHPERIKKTLTAFHDPRIGSVWAAYDYDQDEYGHCVMLLYRERVTRKSWWTWKGRIHETQQPIRACAHVKLSITDPDAFWVTHQSRKERIVQSSDRNLRIAQRAYEEEQAKEAFDPRTCYDYARALKASGNREQALEVFQQFIRLSEFDPDKYEAWLSMADIYRKFRMYHEAEKADFEAIRLCPQRAEAYFGMAETAFCQERFSDVEWFTRIGLSCPPREDNLPTDPIALQARPLLPLHFAQFQQGKFQEALTTAQKTLSWFPRNQFLLDSVQTYQEAIAKEKLEQAWLLLHNQLSLNGESEKLPALARATPDFVADHPVAVRLRNRLLPQPGGAGNRLVIYCGPSYELWDPKCVGEGIGGSEEAVIHLAPRLAKLGWDVTVYNNCLEEGNYDGALWKPFWTYDQSVPCDIFIAWRDSRSILLAPDSAYVFLWVHDMVRGEHLAEKELERVDEILVLSEYHAGVIEKAVAGSSYANLSS